MEFEYLGDDGQIVKPDQPRITSHFTSKKQISKEVKASGVARNPGCGIVLYGVSAFQGFRPAPPLPRDKEAQDEFIRCWGEDFSGFPISP